MKEPKITVFIARPETDYLEQAEIDNTLETMQKIVGGYIETVTLSKDTVLICNEEGRLKGLQPSARILGEVYFGNVILAGYDEDGEFCSIPLDFVS